MHYLAHIQELWQFCMCVYDSYVFYFLSWGCLFHHVLKGGEKRIATTKVLVRGLTESFEHIITFKLFKQERCCQFVAGRTGWFILQPCLAWAAPAFREGREVPSCSQPRLVDTRAYTGTHTHAHTLSCGAELCLLTTTCCSLPLALSLSLCLYITSSSPALPFLIPIWVCVPGMKGWIAHLCFIFLFSSFLVAGGYF